MTEDWTPTCPKCGHPRQPWADECEICGIVFVKYAQSAARRAIDDSELKKEKRRKSKGKPPKKGSSALRKAVMGCGCLLVLLAALLAGVFFVFLWQFKSSDAYTMAEDFARTSDEVAALVGRPVSIGAFPTGNIQITPTGSSAGTASFSIPVNGPAGKTRVLIGLELADGTWKVVGASAEYPAGVWHELSTVPYVAPELDDPPDLVIESLAPEIAEQVAQHLARGNELFEQRQWESAIDQYDDVIVLDPNNAEAYLQRGWCWARMEQDGMALSDLERALELGTSTHDVRDQIGLLYYKKDDWDRCIEHLSASIELEPDNNWALDMRARCYYLLGDVDSARKDAQKACDLGHEDGCRTLESLD